MNQELYVSQYLNVYPSHRDSSILFHGITGSIDEVAGDLGALLKKKQSSQLPIAQELENSTLIFLQGRGHLTRERPQEESTSFKTYVEKLHNKINEARVQQGSLMIVPSYHCNLACHYCYQNPMRAREGKNAQNVMSANMADVIFTKLLKNLFPKVEHLSRININLYGGEPFLERNREALGRIFHHTQKLQMSVSAISNASALTGFLNFFGCERGLVNSLQISFDGDKMTHDKSRITHYGGGTFDDIVGNIHDLIDRGAHINLRVNTSKDNVDTLNMLWERLEKEEITSHPHVTTYAAAIHNHFQQTSQEPLFTPMKLATIIEKQNLKIASPMTKTVSRMTDIFDADVGIPLRRTSFCMQNSPSAFLVDMRSDIYSCYEEAGNQKLVVGHFNDTGDVILNDRYRVYQSRHVAQYEPCAKCSIALTCGGGCPVAARGISTDQNGIFKNHCDSHKELTAKAIQRLFKQKIEGEFLPKSSEGGPNAWLSDKPYA